MKSSIQGNGVDYELVQIAKQRSAKCGLGIVSKENTTRPEFTIAQGIDYEAPKKLVDPKSGPWVQNCPSMIGIQLR